ncbi:MAG: hypothetical protein GY854_03755 [Deltaproteobacteria bacterium]|nr:hypothetical protein [Deltaproteobacteria bacterium]
MKKVIKGLFAAALLAATVASCSYGAIALTPSNKLVVMRNDAFLFGALRSVYVCDVTGTGLTNCVKSEEKP